MLTIELNTLVEASCFKPTIEPEALVEANSNTQINLDFRVTRDRSHDVRSLIQAPIVRSQLTRIKAYQRSSRALKRRKFFDKEATLTLLVRAEPKPKLLELIKPIKAILVEDAIQEDAPSQLKAIDLELQLLKEYKTYIVVAELPDQKQLILSIQVFKKRFNTNGSIARHKARLVTKGCRQKYSIDYTKTFTPIVQFTIVLFLLIQAIINNFTIDYIDVNIAFLNPILKEEIYIDILDYFQRINLKLKGV